MSFFHLLESLFTCFLKDKTLHNHWDYAGFTVPYYNIPSNNRELQLIFYPGSLQGNYNIPSNNRELQPHTSSSAEDTHYNIPSNNRELQLLSLMGWLSHYYNIPSNNRELQLQVLLVCLMAYYNIPSNNRELQHKSVRSSTNLIITYQVITGNYSYNVLWESSDNIFKKYKWKKHQ